MNLLDLLKTTIKQIGIDLLSKKLEVNAGAINRWILLNKVPEYYKLDLYKINNIPIDYSLLSDKEKDKFYTDKDTAKYCLDVLYGVLKSYEKNIEQFVFVEPSVGSGNFYNLIPNEKIAIDIQPEIPDAITADYLTWTPSDLTKRYVVVGNPPFGLRSNMALRFINHSQYAEYVAFILPQTFESNGKGSCKKRVKGFNLIHSEKVSPKFYFPDGKSVNVNVVFQIWAKHHRIIEQSQTANTFINLYSVSDGATPSETRNKHMIGKCDFYLPITCFGETSMCAYDDLMDVPKKIGIGIVVTQERDTLIPLLKNFHWHKIAFKSTNGAYNMRFDLVHKAVVMSGYVDKNINEDFFDYESI
jgi:hypothetical protein